MNQSYLTAALRAVYVLFLTAVCGAVGYYSFPLTYPFVIALILAIMINPFVEWLDKLTGFPRGVNVGIVLFGFLTAGAGFLTLVVAEIVSGTAYLAKILPLQFNKAALYIESFFTNQIMPLYNELAAFFDGLEAAQQESIITQVQNLGSELASGTALLLSKILETVPLFFAFLPNMAAVLIFSLLATFFISKDLHKIQNKARSVLPDRLISGAAAVYAELKLRRLLRCGKPEKSAGRLCEGPAYPCGDDDGARVDRAFRVEGQSCCGDRFSDRAGRPAAVFGNRVCICAVDCLFSSGQTAAAGDRPWNSVHRRTCLQAACRTEDFKPVNRTSPFGNINRAVCRFQIVWLSRIDHGPRPSRSYSGSLYNRYF